MKFSITNLLLIISVVGLIAVVVTDRTSHQNLVTELKKSHQAELLELEAVMSCESNVRHTMALGRWIEDDDVEWHWNTMALMGVWHLHVDKDVIDCRQDLVRQYGPNPALKMAGELLEKLDCDSFEQFVEQYKKMEKNLRLSPNPITVPDTPEQIKMIEFISSALEDKNST